MWIDQFEADGVQFSGDSTAIWERSLVTRPGTNGGGEVHADVLQYHTTSGGGAVCMLGIRSVPVYANPESSGPGCYKISNQTQGGDPAEPIYAYSNWLDGSTNDMLAHNDNFVANNKLGYFYQASAWSANDHGGNVWECDGSPISGSNKNLAPNCLWGWSSWRGTALDGYPPSVSCYGSFDAAPIDPTESGWP
jgi:hypothetical protein